MDKIIQEFRNKNLGKILSNVSLKNYTTYKVGGNAKYMIFPRNVDCLIEIIRCLKDNDIKHMVLGNGSNVVFSDNIYDGVIIKLDEINNIDIDEDKCKVVAGAGASLIKVALQCCRRGLTGLEFATGIPGSIGGAVYMNAGAYKSDMGYVVTKVKVLTDDLKVITMVNKEMNFHYRSSFFQNNKNYICLEVTMKLQKGKKDVIEEVVSERRKRRMESQPLEYPSAGSVFRNPENDFAGRLIEELGYKGLVKGGAQVSNKHANFVVNVGNASASDIKGLIDFIRDSVFENYGIKLKVEQEFINWE